MSSLVIFLVLFTDVCVNHEQIVLEGVVIPK